MSERGSTWDYRFLRMAEEVASWSKDPSTKVGCVLVNPATRTVISTGFNGFPREVDEHPQSMVLKPGADPTDPEARMAKDLRWDRPQKYSFIEHAERNAVYNAARNGHATEGAWAYMNWSPLGLCTDCARALIQAGVKRVYGPARPFPGLDDRIRYDISRIMAQEADMTLIEMDDE